VTACITVVRSPDVRVVHGCGLDVAADGTIVDVPRRGQTPVHVVAKGKHTQQTVSDVGLLAIPWVYADHPK
jgi:hypothetical protein